MSEPLYSIGTWATDQQSYTPHLGLSVPAFNITRRQLRQALRELRDRGYSCHRYRDSDGGHRDSDFSVLVERTDGKPVKEIRRGWQRKH